MTVSLVYPQQNMDNLDYRYRSKQTLVSAGTTNPVLVFGTMRDVNCAAYPAPGSTARFEYTISSSTEVINETAVWFVWPAGNVSVNTVDSLFSNATAIRGVTDGEATFEMSGV